MGFRLEILLRDVETDVESYFLLNLSLKQHRPTGVSRSTSQIFAFIVGGLVTVLAGKCRSESSVIQGNVFFLQNYQSLISATAMVSMLLIDTVSFTYALFSRLGNAALKAGLLTKFLTSVTQPMRSLHDSPR